MISPSSALKNARELVALFSSVAEMPFQDIGPFEYVGSGCSRSVYRRGDYVYKLETSYGRDAKYYIMPEGWANVAEFNQAIRLAKLTLPDIWVIPEMLVVHAGSPVMVMPFIKGTSLDNLPIEESGQYNSLIHALNQDFDLRDVYWQNIILFEGKLHMIDLGEYQDA